MDEKRISVEYDKSRIDIDSIKDSLEEKGYRIK
jgi:copper chaperone CopZ